MEKIYKKITITPSNRYMFLLKKLDNKLKISKDILYINYKENLIYKNLIYLLKNNHLYIYSIEAQKRFILPEGLLLYYGIQKDGIYIIKNPNNYYNLLIIKNNILQKDMFLSKIIEAEIELLKFEYNLDIKSLDYNEYIKKGYNNLSLLELIKLWDLTNFNKTKLKENILDLGRPILIATAIITLLSFGIKKYYENIYTKKLDQFNTLKKETLTIRKKEKNIEKIATTYKLLEKKVKNNKISIANMIAKNIKIGRISYLKIDKNKFLLTIDANNSEKNILALNKIKFLKDIKLVSSVKISKKLKRFRIEGKLVD